MSHVAIQVAGLSKQYRIGEFERYKALRDTLPGVISAPFRTMASLVAGRPSKNTARASNGRIWALDNVSFEIKRGEIVGIIGRNGAGKSTLLKILSRIIEPNEGYAKIHGRVGSLLEVGTGFHPDLTGRENVYLNGAILGMRKAEIGRKFDAIVSFAEVEKFIDTPVKYFSSGMYMRLAFAVAAHLEPEILLVDEVLAVGDAAFQKKCLGKMGDVAGEGRTVVLVSHNMAAIQTLCDIGAVINHGKLATIGPVGQAIHYYHELLRRIETETTAELRGLKVLTVGVAPDSGGSTFTSDGPLVAEMDFYTEHRLSNCYLNFHVEDLTGQSVIHFRTDRLDMWPSFDPGIHHVVVEVPRLSLKAGIYTIWFRVYIDRGDITAIADSERIVLEVNGPLVDGLVDVPCRWSWTPVEA